jgi:hypothetical protein
MKVRYQYDDKDTKEWIILNWNLGKCFGLWTGCIWPGIGSVDRILWTRQRNFGFRRKLEMCSLFSVQSVYLCTKTICTYAHVFSFQVKQTYNHGRYRCMKSTQQISFTSDRRSLKASPCPTRWWCGRNNTASPLYGNRRRWMGGKENLILAFSSARKLWAEKM